MPHETEFHHGFPLFKIPYFLPLTDSLLSSLNFVSKVEENDIFFELNHCDSW